MTPEKEKELLTALSKGNQSAFDSLYLFYAPKVREFVFRLLKNPGEAEDVTQNIFLRVWEKRRELGGTRSLRSYLYTMARNAVFDIFSHSIVEDKYMQEHINSAAERRDAPLSEKIETEELALLIAVAVDRMPEQRRRAFSLSRYEELSNKEIAERLNLSVKTVERHMTAALSQLRRLLKERLAAEGIETLLAVSHGSASRQFIKAAAPEGFELPAKLPNCAIMIFNFDEAKPQAEGEPMQCKFTLQQIVDPQ